MRPRGDTQRRYNEAIQSLSGKKAEKSPSLNKPTPTMKSLKTVTRRTACPQTIVQLWQAISFIRQQKQISNLTRISAQMKKMHGLSLADVEKELDNAVHDGLIAVKTRVGCKGSKIGIEQDGYRIPNFEVKTDDHDWYCFTCHKGGEMALCSTCYRVFHEECVEGEYDSTNFVCDICKLLKGKYQVQLGKEELNELLSYTCMRLKEKTRELHRIPHPSEDKERHDLFIFYPMDLCSMEQKMKTNAYETLEQFYVDALQVVHNAVIYYGAITKHAAIATRMVYDCEYDLNEIEQCRHCYRMSNQKDKELWFCQPCDPPHELVFAKQKGYPFWPAKVVKKENNRYDVRFFGAFHQRASIHEDYVRPTTATLQSMGLKKTASLVRALNELKRHQSLVADFKSGKTSNRKRTFEKASVPTVVEQGEENEEKKKKLPVTKIKATIPNGSTKDEEPKTKTRVGRKKGKRKHHFAKAEKTPQTSTPQPPEPKRRRLKQKSDDLVKEDNTLNPNPDSEVKSKDGPVEDQNIVSSSSQEVAVTFATATCQTSSDLLKDLIEDDDTKSDEVESVDEKKPCNCATELDDKFLLYKEQVFKEYQKEKARALKESTEKIKKELALEREKMLTELCQKEESKREQLLKKLQEDFNFLHRAEIQKVVEQHALVISEIKKKQWCYNCELEAIYHCCWNTAYCSVACQQAHWHEEHKRTCRRKR